jgi:hypothetical protein
MFQRTTQGSIFPAAIAVALVATITVVIAALVDAVAGMESFI